MSKTAMSDDLGSIRSGMTGIFRKVLVDDQFTLRDDMTPDDVDGWDSMTSVSLVLEINAFFGIDLEVIDMIEMREDRKTIAALALLIQQKIRAKA